MTGHCEGQHTLHPHSMKNGADSCPTETADLAQFTFSLKGLINITHLANIRVLYYQITLEYSIHFNSVLALRHSTRAERFSGNEDIQLCIKSGYPNSK